MEIDFLLEKEIKEYCELNGINFADYINKLLKKAFMTDKYGEKPAFLEKKNDKINEKDTPILEEVKEAVKEEKVNKEKPVNEEINKDVKKRGRPKKETTITIKTFKPEKEIIVEKVEEKIEVKPKKRKLL